MLKMDILKGDGNEAFEVLTELFNNCITLYNVPKDWKNAIIILLFKKGWERRYKKLSFNQPTLNAELISEESFEKSHTEIIRHSANERTSRIPQ